MDTIFANATGRPPAALAIVRISGSQSMAAARLLAGSLPPPRRAALRALRDAEGGLLDQAVVLTFPAPASATGEDIVELHCHGGRAIIDAIERRLATMPALRQAEPGEFTRRALLNGRIDLIEAQGLADLLEAETEEQRVAAVAAVEGRVSQQVKTWIAALRDIQADVEADLNFADDVDSLLSIDEVLGRIATVRQSLVDALSAPPVERLKDGVRVVLAGPPNAGKSTLLNLLAEREAAIVSPVSGTTRDRIEAPVQRSGRAYLLIDTAGLIDSSCAIEAEGVKRAREALAQADILLWLGEAPPPRDRATWVQARGDEEGRSSLLPGREVVVTRERQSGIVELWKIIEREADKLLPSADRLLFKREQLRHLARAVDALFTAERDLVLVAERVRAAVASLSGLLGYRATEEMLESLLSRLCIGK